MEAFKKFILDEKNFPAIVLLSGLVPLVLALISQYGFGLHPCELCIYQRYPYVSVIALGLALFLFKGKAVVLLGVLAALSHFINSGIAFYHVGVEQLWWSYGDCSGEFDMSSVESLKKSLFSAPAVRCDEVQFSFLGLSMAGWNVLYTLAIGVFIIISLKKYNNERRS